MQGGSRFGRIDVLAVELRLQAFGELRRLGEIEQGIQRRAVVALAGEVRIDRADAQREVGRPRRIVGDQRPQRDMGEPRGVRAEQVEVGRKRVGVHAPQYHAACFGIE